MDTIRNGAGRTIDANKTTCSKYGQCDWIPERRTFGLLVGGPDRSSDVDAQVTTVEQKHFSQMEYLITNLTLGRAYMLFLQACNAVGCRNSTKLGPVVAALPPSAPPEPKLRTAEASPVPYLDIFFGPPMHNGGSPIVYMEIWKDDGLGGNFSL